MIENFAPYIDNGIAVLILIYIVPKVHNLERDVKELKNDYVMKKRKKG